MKTQPMKGQTLMPLDVPALTAGLRDRLLRLIRLDWQDDAGCTTSWRVEDDPFFPDPTDAHLVHEAKGICGSCPVRVSCLASALVRDEGDGIWGGATPADRDRIKVELALGDPVGVALSGVNLALTPQRPAA